MKKGLIIGIVAVIACCAVAFGVHHQIQRTAQMRAAVDSAFVQNRNYVPFTSDSTLREVAAYFDHPLHFWITANDRLRAHYALGCVYRDLHDAPIALLTWEDAIAAADTTAADCDFATLFRVYGQMASIYFRQSMPEKELGAREAYCKYALLAGDTLNYIRGLLLRNEAFLALGDTAAIYQNIANVRQLYLQRGLKAEAAQVYPTAIQIAIDKQQFVRADSMMQIFEQESELLSEGGTIAQGYERYYYHKGMYYLGVGQPDSAEHWFRKLLQCEPALIDAYRGLLSLYRQKSDADSVFRYARLYEDALARYLKRTHIQSVDLAKGMYDYSSQQQLAQRESRRANTFRFALVMLLAVMIIVGLQFMRYSHKKSAERRKQLATYRKTLDDLDAARRETELLQQSLSKNDATRKLLKEKEDQIGQLEMIVKELQKQIGKSAAGIHVQRLKETGIVKK
ncbi:MAG: hypothetical protein IJ647_10535, partial [Prevotella sp.]|nr:hypothetical protein [Prevotella sp.]